MKLYIYHTWIPGIDKWQHEIRETKDALFCHLVTEVDFEPNAPSPKDLIELQKKKIEKNIQDCRETAAFWEKELQHLEAKLPTNNEEMVK